MEPAFSRRGEAATPFERDLIAQLDASTLRSEQELWIHLARRVGLDALLLIFDEMGGRKVWLPTRETFVQLGWDDIRRNEMLRMRAAGKSLREVARTFGVSRTTVIRVTSPRPFGVTPDREKQRA